MVVDALAHSMGLAQRTLFHATELAREHGLSIEDGRAVGAYTGVAPVGPNVPQNVRDAYTKELGQISEVNGLIEEALREASQADAKASAELDKLAKTINVSDTSQAHNEILVEASHVEFDILRADIPVGKDPHLVRTWWDGLTPQQQKDLMRADPVTLADLKGLPPEVGREMRGPDGKVDRVEMVRYALDHWDKKDELDYGALGNCTNFVSSSLEAGGMKKKIDPWTGLMGDDAWGRQSGTGWDWLDQHAYHSESWARAEGLQNFLLRHGSKEVPRTEAQPGDIVFYEQVASGTETAPGETHHAAVVTSVTPDGDIKLTQHTSSFQNVSLDSREHIANRNGGEQRIRIVRPEPDWY
ncbi:amidase domain-containing protein [Streptomyces sp. NBC_00161]|uniref:amidase domain-containing protein n=1 Tax=Streptomyces sp. NBC_00161 TaxID=2975671 RepID=UPI0032565010